MSRAQGQGRGAKRKRRSALSLVPFLLSPSHLITLAVILLLPVDAPADRMTAVASIFPLYEFAVQVGGDKLEAAILIPPGSEPHTWDPRPSDIVRLGSADIFIYVGDRMEPWAAELLRSLGDRMPAVLRMDTIPTSRSPAQSERGKPREEGGIALDPHIWLDFGKSVEFVGKIADTLSKLDPSNASHYRAGAQDYSRVLEDLDRRFARGLASCRRRIFVTGGHGAFGHLAARYGLTQLPIYGLSPDSEPSPRYISDIIRTMSQEGIKVLYFEELISPRLAEVIARETGARSLVLHPGGNLTGRQWREGVTFVSLMERNLENLREGLECE
ncbi:MAG: zinc ABC transporter substrate-binding protein [bacterium]|nr:MAG: zinc ABC transporter substrate-binding protein [bacterium]